MTDMIASGAARRVLPRFTTLALLAAQFMSPAAAPAMVLGTDDRNEASAFFSPEDENRFEGVGRIECLQPGSRGTSFNATGWVVGSADTAITAAHIFFQADRHGNRTVRRDPQNCIFVLFNRDQSVREIVNIRYAVSPWADAAARGDSAQDYAVLKLVRPVQVSHIPSVGIDRPIRPDVQLVAFQSGVSEQQRARITRGEARRFPAFAAHHELDGVHISNSARLFTTSANSSPGSSGGLYYDRDSGAALGLHLGAMCDPSARNPGYDPQSCFNYGLRFDRKVHRVIDAVVRDMAPHDQRINPDSPQPDAASIILALAS